MFLEETQGSHALLEDVGRPKSPKHNFGHLCPWKRPNSTRKDEDCYGTHSQGCGFVSHPSSFKGTKAKPFNKLESPIKHQLVPEVRNSLCWSGVRQNRQKFIRGSSQVRQVHQKFVRQLGRGWKREWKQLLFLICMAKQLIMCCSPPARWGSLDSIRIALSFSSFSSFFFSCSSTASSRCRWALPDLSREHQMWAGTAGPQLQITAGTVGPQLRVQDVT